MSLWIKTQQKVLVNLDQVTGLQVQQESTTEWRVYIQAPFVWYMSNVHLGPYNTREEAEAAQRRIEDVIKLLSGTNNYFLIDFTIPDPYTGTLPERGVKPHDW